tara:strand:- start:4421 stop:4618 length:198 start_codon:yes stop_codon:yes gene_type:complete
MEFKKIEKFISLIMIEKDVSRKRNYYHHSRRNYMSIWRHTNRELDACPEAGCGYVGTLNGKGKKQ